jgi:hypothetical protein
MPVVAGHELLAADRRPPRFAGCTCFTGNDCRHDDSLADPIGRLFATSNNATGDLMTQDQGEGVTGRNAVNGKADIGVADSASRDFHDYLVVDGLERGQLDPFKG